MTLTLLSPRQKATTWARRIASDESVVFVDTETTGLGAEAEIVDLAVVGHDGTVLLDSLICPLKTIPVEAVKVHGITARMVAKAPLFADLHPRIATVLRDRLLVGWNSTFDVGIVRRVCAAHKLPDVVGCWQDAMLAYADFDGTPNTKNGRPGLTWWKLGEACAHFGIDPGGHRALGDALACRAVVAAMAEAAP